MVARLGDPDTAEAVRRVLAAGGIAIIPCDTIYGLVGVPETESRISRVKGRLPDKPFLRLIGDESWLARYTAAALPPQLRPFWPGPLTVVFPDRAGGTIAVRVPADPWLHGLLAALDRPLVSTSVNREGEPPLGVVAEIVERFESEVDMVVDGGDRTDRTPSTLLDATARPYRVLRQGPVQIPAELTRAP